MASLLQKILSQFTPNLYGFLSSVDIREDLEENVIDFLVYIRKKECHTKLE